jgi:hypothetical protein
MSRIASLSSLALIAICCAHEPVAAQNTTFRISCERFEGVRAQFAAHPASPPEQKNRLIKQEDAISGVRLVLTFSTAGTGGSVTTFGNVNTDGGVQSFAVNRLADGDVLSFVGTDPKDGSTNLLTVFPAQSRLLWTVHTNKIYVLDQIVLGKTFIGACTLQKP